MAALTFDTVEGCFTRRDGAGRALTSGRGVLSVRQWHAYPNILPRELYSDSAKAGEKFETLSCRRPIIRLAGVIGCKDGSAGIKTLKIGKAQIKL